MDIRLSFRSGSRGHKSMEERCLSGEARAKRYHNRKGAEGLLLWLNQDGLAALPTVIIISVIVLLAGMGIAGTGFIESLLSLGNYESKQALYIAEAGAHDALKRLVRDKNCSCNYTLTVGDGTATLSVTGSNPKTIVSKGELKMKKRQIRIVVSWDANDEVTYSEWKEVTD